MVGNRYLGKEGPVRPWLGSVAVAGARYGGRRAEGGGRRKPGAAAGGLVKHERRRRTAGSKHGQAGAMLEAAKRP